MGAARPKARNDICVKDLIVRDVNDRHWQEFGPLIGRDLEGVRAVRVACNEEIDIATV